jgi:hypothetical protein
VAWECGIIVFPEAVVDRATVREQLLPVFAQHVAAATAAAALLATAALPAAEPLPRGVSSAFICGHQAARQPVVDTVLSKQLHAMLDAVDLAC